MVQRLLTGVSVTTLPRVCVLILVLPVTTLAQETIQTTVADEVPADWQTFIGSSGSPTELCERVAGAPWAVEYRPFGTGLECLLSSEQRPGYRTLRVFSAYGMRPRSAGHLTLGRRQLAHDRVWRRVIDSKRHGHHVCRRARGVLRNTCCIRQLRSRGRRGLHQTLNHRVHDAFGRVHSGTGAHGVLGRRSTRRRTHGSGWLCRDSTKRRSSSRSRSTQRNPPTGFARRNVATSIRFGLVQSGCVALSIFGNNTDRSL